MPGSDYGNIPFADDIKALIETLETTINTLITGLENTVGGLETAITNLENTLDDMPSFIKNSLIIAPLTTGRFLSASVGGNMNGDEQKLNDGLTGSSCSASLNQYAIFDFGAFYNIKQFRHFGQPDQHSDGEWKLQYWTGTAWTDWATFSTRIANWSSWVECAEITTGSLRLLCTVQDTGGSAMIELEVKF